MVWMSGWAGEGFRKSYADKKRRPAFASCAPAAACLPRPDDLMMDHVEVSKLGAAWLVLSYARRISRPVSVCRVDDSASYYCDPIEGIDSGGRPAQPTTISNVTKQHEKKLKMLPSTHQREWCGASWDEPY